MRKTGPAPRGYTLVEMMIGLTLASILMLGVLSSYLFIGRNSVRLSYQHALETQARGILNTFAGDVRNTKYITSASATGMTLQLVDGSTVTYSYSSSLLTRDPGSGGVSVTNDIKGETVQVPVTLAACNFNYFTTTDASPTYQATSAIVALSVKQVALSLTLQAGSPTVQANSGTMTSFQMSSGWLLFRNKQLPNGT